MAAAPSLQQPPEGYNVLSEGKAKILFQGNSVFYNEAQVTNRDLSVSVLRTFLPQLKDELAAGTLKRHNRANPRHNRMPSQAGATGTGAAARPEGAYLLEGLAATGLRSLRYALEVEGVAAVDANDNDAAAVEAMKRNIEYNGPAAAKINVLCSDARLVMLQNSGTYDAVDLDPYGCPSHLLDSAVQSVADGGLLLVTATDMAVLCGNNGEACWAKYGCYPVHRAYCHEMAVRILLACIEGHANRYKRHITPLLSVSLDFYVRVFVRVHTSAATTKESAAKMAYLYQSQGCDSFALQRVGQKGNKGGHVKYAPSAGPVVPQRCPETGSGYLMGGPIWAEPIHDPDFVQRLSTHVASHSEYAAQQRLLGVLNLVGEELVDVPLYYSLHELSKTIKCQPPKAETFRSALLNASYRVSGSHANPLAIKTNAPPEVIWDVMRCWVKEHPVRITDTNSYAAKLLAKEPELQANFSRHAGAISRSKASGAPRFVQNPAGWGPKSRAGRIVKEAGVDNGGGPQKRRRGTEGAQEEPDEPDAVLDAAPHTGGAPAAAGGAEEGGDGAGSSGAAGAAAGEAAYERLLDMEEEREKQQKHAAGAKPAAKRPRPADGPAAGGG